MGNGEMQVIRANRPAHETRGLPFDVPLASMPDIHTFAREHGNSVDIRHEDDRVEHVKARLFAFGGWCVAGYGPEDFLSARLPRFDCVSAEGVVRIEMQGGRCHRNASELHLRSGTKADIVTGFALTGDGIWRRHSWVESAKGGGRALYETTYDRNLYCGVRLTEDEAHDFALRNLSEHEFDRFVDLRDFTRAVSIYKGLHETTEASHAPHQSRAKRNRDARDGEREI